MQLIGADIGVETSADILSDLDKTLKQRATGHADLMTALYESMVSVLRRAEQPLALPEKKPFVILVVGVNGVGKTTTIGKLTHLLQQDGLSVLLAAGDTFRAAAIEQIQHWGERVGAPVISQHPERMPPQCYTMPCRQPSPGERISSSPIPPGACTTRTT